MKDKLLQWFVNGRVGVSSKAMACAVAGLKQDKTWGANHPRDPDDFNRCLLLMKAVPEIRKNMGLVASMSETWWNLVQRWDDVEKCFLEEVGFDWCKGNRAPKTYKLMKEIGC